MKIYSARAVTIGIAAFGMLVSISSIILAQKTNKSHTQNERAQTARDEIAKSPVGTLVFKAISAKENKWRLFDASFLERHERNKAVTISMSFRNGRDQLSIDVGEYDSPEAAEKRFDSPRQYGGSVPFNVYGDRGEAVTGEKG